MTTERTISRRLILIGSLSAASAGALFGCGRDSETKPAESSTDDGREFVEIRVDGSTFNPVVELIDGSEAEVIWVDLDTNRSIGTGYSPALEIGDVHRVGLAVVTGDQPAFHDVVTLNFGFNYKDDLGDFSINKNYNHDPQPVVGISNLQLLTQLVRFCAAHTQLAGKLDLRGLARLEFVECYDSQIDSLDVTGCSSLIRLCIEHCQIPSLDLNPVRRTLRDLRAAVQRSGDRGLTFAKLDGPMEALYHYCVRDQVVHQTIPHRDLPVVEQYWVWGTQQHTCDAPTSAVLRSYLADDNPLDQASVDRVLTALHKMAADEPGRVDLAGRKSAKSPAAPSAAGMAAAAALVASGWRVSTN